MTPTPTPTEPAAAAPDAHAELAAPVASGVKPPASSMKVYLRLLSYTRPYLAFFMLSVVGFAIAGACKAALASVFKHFVDGLAAPDASVGTGLLIG